MDTLSQILFWAFRVIMLAMVVSAGVHNAVESVFVNAFIFATIEVLVIEECNE